jgi:hypothetical protein
MIRGIADPILSRAIENYVDGELHKLLNQAVWPLAERVKRLEARTKHLDRLLQEAGVPSGR